MAGRHGITHVSPNTLRAAKVALEYYIEKIGDIPIKYQAETSNKPPLLVRNRLVRT
jgi:hypothetical protein